MNRTKDYLTNLPGHLALPSVPATRPGHPAQPPGPGQPQPSPATRPGPGRARYPARLSSLAMGPATWPGPVTWPGLAQLPGPAKQPGHSLATRPPSPATWPRPATRPPGHPATRPWPATWPGPGYLARLPSPAGLVGGAPNIYIYIYIYICGGDHSPSGDDFMIFHWNCLFFVLNHNT